MKTFYYHLPKWLLLIIIFCFQVHVSNAQIAIEDCDMPTSSNACPEVTAVAVTNLQENEPDAGQCTFTLNISWTRNTANNSSLL